MAEKLNYNKIYQSNNFGPYRILRPMERVNSRKMVLIEFTDTGCQKIVREDAALSGSVKDDLYGIDFNKTYYSNLYGPFIILKFVGRNNEGRRLILIKFLNTGNEKVITHKAAMLGYAVDEGADRDPINPRVLDNQDKYIQRLLKGVWKCMMSRCYSEKDPQYGYYGAIGVSVCEEWKNRNIFLKTIIDIPQFDKYYNNPYGYQLDKDYLQLNIPKNLRVYSKETCMFLSNEDNSNLSVIERDINNPNKPYYGVEIQKCGTFRTVVYMNGIRKEIGTFSNIIAAANAFNYFQQKYHQYELIPLLNNVPYMNPYGFYKYKVGYKTMVNIIK